MIIKVSDAIYLDLDDCKFAYAAGRSIHVERKGIANLKFQVKTAKEAQDLVGRINEALIIEENKRVANSVARNVSQSNSPRDQIGRK